MIQVVYRRGRGQYHVGEPPLAGERPGVRMTLCGRWLRNATTTVMEEADYRALGDRRCGHCLRRWIG